MKRPKLPAHVGCIAHVDHPVYGRRCVWGPRTGYRAETVDGTERLIAYDIPAESTGDVSAVLDAIAESRSGLLQREAEYRALGCSGTSDGRPAFDDPDGVRAQVQTDIRFVRNVAGIAELAARLPKRDVVAPRRATRPVAARSTAPKVIPTAPPVPAPSAVRERPSCPRCGQTFRVSGVGYAWHVANRPDCAAARVAA